MPFSKTPAESTYQTKVIHLVKELNSRAANTTKDEDYVNVFPELIKNRTTGENQFKLIKRDGCTSAIASVSATDVRGSYYWKDLNRIYLAINSNVYVYHGSTFALITTLVGVFGSSSGTVGFCEFLYDTGIAKLVTTDGTTLSTIDNANTVVACTDLDLPTHLPYPVFLDGYLFVVANDTADIYNSNLNDPLLYTAGDFITAEMRADKLNYLAVLNNYIVAFGSKSIEYFWDAAIATGSPLQRNDTPIKLVGMLGGFAQLGNKIYFVGESETSQPNVFVLEDFKITPLGNEAVRRHLSGLTSVSVAGLIGNCVSMKGHDFYVLNTGSSTYALELESQLWTRWTFQQTTTMPITMVLNINNAAGFKSLFSLSGSTLIYKFDPDLYQDNSTNFTCTIITDKIKFDTYRSKVMGSLYVWSNKTSTSASMTIQWSDDDYQSYNTGRSVDISKERPTVTALGQFRERAFKITFTANFPLILEGMEADINMGQG